MQTQYSAVTISIPKVKVSHLQKNVFLYEIDVATRWAKWHLEKRYSEFQQLHKFLQKQFNDLPQFPSSVLGYFIGEDEDDVAEYKDMLEEYLKGTSLRKDIINSQYYSQFLQLNKNSQALLSNKPKFDGQFQLEEKTADQGKVIVDFHYNQNYFVFATGNNSPLQKFNAVLANTKFPWEEEEDAEFILPLGTIQCWICKKKPYKYSRIWARNYPVQVTKLLFNPDAEVMICGLADGGVQLFRLYTRGRNIYYEVVKIISSHQDSITGLHLDSVNMTFYTASADGFLNVFQAKNGVLLNSKEFSCQIMSMSGDAENMRLFVAMSDGNLQIISYDYKGKLRVLSTLCTPDTGSIRCIVSDMVKNYLFASGYQSGNIYIFDIGKPGQQKFAKQIAILKNKEKVVSMSWIPKKMQLIVANETGQIFFWNCLQGKQIFMLRVFQETTEMSKIQYLPQSQTLITVQKGRMIKFWVIPKTWRDHSTEAEQEREIQIRRKVQNLHKVREAVKKKQQDSDDDDLACWYRSESSDEEQQSWLNFDF